MAPPVFERAVAHGLYTGTLRSLLHLLKYDGLEPVADKLGALLAAPFGLLSRLPELHWIPAAMLVAAAVLFLAQALRGWNLIGGGTPSFLRHVGGLFARPLGWRGYALGVVLGFLPCGQIGRASCRV